jgi:hypothetical protein
MKNKISIFVGLLAFAAATLFGVSSVANASLTNPPSNQRVFEPRAAFVSFDTALRVANDTNSTARFLPQAAVLDVQYVVVANEGSTPFTLTVQFSNDGTNWAQGQTLFVGATSAAGSTNMTRTHAFGSYVRFAVDTTNSTPLTLTLNATSK